jgi:Methyltransferase domain
MHIDLHAIERPVLTHFRKKRLDFLYRTLALTTSSRVIDLGGTLFFWELAREQGYATPKITIVNLDKPRQSVPSYAEWIVADALNLPFTTNHFDFVFSNSLIEHLGTRELQNRLATEIQRLAPRYFVQTPDRRFFLEPHLLTPFVHWLPPPLRGRMIRNFTVWGLITRPSRAQCQSLQNEICLLDPEEMGRLFPQGEIHVEKFLGMPKSVIAIKT